MGWWEDRAKDLDKVTRGKNADHSKAGGIGLARKIDRMAEGSGKKYSNSNVQRAAERRVSSAPRTLYGAEAEWKKKKDFDDATSRYKKDRSSYNRKAKDSNMQDSVDVENYRKNRIANKEYKGKYYGPDAFKGDMNKLKAWRKAGSPKDVKAFAKSHPNTGR